MLLHGFSSLFWWLLYFKEIIPFQAERWEVRKLIERAIIKSLLTVIGAKKHFKNMDERKIGAFQPAACYRQDCENSDLNLNWTSLFWNLTSIYLESWQQAAVTLKAKRVSLVFRFSVLDLLCVEVKEFSKISSEVFSDFLYLFWDLFHLLSLKLLASVKFWNKIMFQEHE